MKEGCQYKTRVTFRVQHNVVLGLQIQNAVYALAGAKKIAEDVEMLGTYPPKNEFQAVDLPKSGWNDCPSGHMYRGDYKAKMKFIDDDTKVHLLFEYTLKIAKDWDDDS